MAVTLSTFGKTEEHLNTFEQTPVTTTVEPTTEPTVTTPTATTEPVTEPTPAAEPAEVDYSTSSFSLGEDEPIVEPNAEPTPAQPQFNLDEELKKIDTKELAKKIGISDFALELNQHLANGGSALDYLNAKAIDYTKVSDENIIKSDLLKKNPLLTPSQVDLVYKRRYMVSEDAEDEDKEFAQVQQTMDANNIRQQLISEQQKFKVPEAITPQKDEAYEQWKVNRDSYQKSLEQVNGYFLNHAATKSLHENKKVAINVGEGIAPFNIAIDKPELITRSLTDSGETWQKLTSTPTGEPDVQKQQMIALFSFNPQKFIQDLFNYGLQQGKRSLVAEGQNAQRPQTPVLPMNPDQKPTYGVGKFGDRGR